MSGAHVREHHRRPGLARRHLEPGLGASPWRIVSAGVAWLALAGATLGLPEADDLPDTATVGAGAATLGLLLVALAPFAGRLGTVGVRLRHAGHL